VIADKYAYQVPTDGVGPIQAKLGDLDIKVPDNDKIAHWRGLESRLIVEGWYTARERNQHPGEENFCVLGW